MAIRPMHTVQSHWHTPPKISWEIDEFALNQRAGEALNGGVSMVDFGDGQSRLFSAIALHLEAVRILFLKELVHTAWPHFWLQEFRYSILYAWLENRLNCDGELMSEKRCGDTSPVYTVHKLNIKEPLKSGTEGSA